MVKSAIYPIILFCIIYTGCEGYGEHGPSFHGRITFISSDTIMTPVSGGKFTVAFFEGSADELKNGSPSFTSTLAPVWSGTEYYSDFSLRSLKAVNYHVAVMWIPDNYNAGDRRPVLGILGCNADPLCTGYQHAAGTVNFSANGDTLNKLFYNVDVTP
jgi:hypothetical protein